MTHEALKANHYCGIVADGGRYALVNVTAHKHSLEAGCMASEVGKFSHTSQELTGEVFNTHDAAVSKVALLNGCAE